MKDIQKIKEFFSKPLDEKKETAVDMAKKQLDALGVKYELSGNEFKPFKAIYRPINKEDRWYDKFEDIIHLFNLGSAVKQSMKEAKFMSGLFSGKDFINAKLKNYPKATAKVNQLIDMIGESRFTIEMAEWIWDFFNNASFESPINEAKKEDAVDTITMDIPLFLRMLEYSREDASQDMDLHDVTEKANKLGKEKGILQMDDYDAIVSAAEDIKEGMTAPEWNSMSKENKIKILQKNFPKLSLKFADWKWEDLTGMIKDKLTGKEIKEGELTEAYVPSNIKEFAKRKGVTSLVNKVAGWAEKVGKGIRGGTAIGYNYSTLILDMTYQGSEIRINTDNDTITLYNEPVDNFNAFQRVYIDGQDLNEASSFAQQAAIAISKKKSGNYDKEGKRMEETSDPQSGKAAPYGSGYKPLEEKIAEALDKINEELCPAGKAYIKRRQAAGEKSSAYLSGRGVKVCKGQMSGKAKKKK